MAFELVITSVPKGIRPGRSGFQLVMRSAALRNDVSVELETLAAYRHLPPGAGPNPECFFHRIVQTNIGPLSVLGRVVDAGAGYDGRSNKLAHLVVVEPGEAVRLASSSPAAVLAAVEPRLARAWRGGPEERSEPFSLAAMPLVAGAVCTTWQSVAGDAGWGGVVAERAAAGRPVLVVAPSSSPDWCRRLLELFEESLALLPPAKRWAVTFDTTILAASSVILRGTYAGSPESGVGQPGVLVIDLTKRMPVPADVAGLPLVGVARGLMAADPAAARAAGLPSAPPPLPGQVRAMEAHARDPVIAPGGPPAMPSTASTAEATRGRQASRAGDRRDDDWREQARMEDRKNTWKMRGAAALLLLAVGAVAAAVWGGIEVARRVSEDVKRQQAERVADAKKCITAWADDAAGREPNHEDYRLYYGLATEPAVAASGDAGSPSSVASLPAWLANDEKRSRLNEALRTPGIQFSHVNDEAGLQRVIASLDQLKKGDAGEGDLRTLGILPDRLPWSSEPEKNDYVDVLVALAGEGRTLQQLSWLREQAVLLVSHVHAIKPDAKIPDGQVQAFFRNALPGDRRGRADQVADWLLGLKEPVEGLTLGNLLKDPERFLAKPEAHADAKKPEPSPEEKQAEQWKKFSEAVNKLKEKPPQWPEKGKPVKLVDVKPPDGLTIAPVTLGTQTFDQSDSGDAWTFLFPLEGEGREEWGTLRADEGSLVLTTSTNVTAVCQYMPLVFVLKGTGTTSIWLGRPKKSSWEKKAKNVVGEITDPLTLTVAEQVVAKKYPLAVLEATPGSFRDTPLLVTIHKEGEFEVRYGDEEGELLETFSWRWDKEKRECRLTLDRQSVKGGPLQQELTHASQLWKSHVKDVLKEKNVSADNLEARLGLVPASLLMAREDALRSTPKSDAVTRSSINGEIEKDKRKEADVSPWPPCFNPARTNVIDARSVSQWLATPAEYLLQDGRTFRKWCMEPPRPLSYENDKAMIDAFLKDEKPGAWAEQTGQSFKEPVERKADQNELIAIYVLQSIWETGKDEENKQVLYDPSQSQLLVDRARQMQVDKAFKETPIGDLLHLTLGIEWQVEGQTVRVPVVEVGGTPK